MTSLRYHVSSPVERSFQRDKSWQHPGRRRHIHGELQPMDTPRDRTGRYFIILALLIGLFFVGQMARGLL